MVEINVLSIVSLRLQILEQFFQSEKGLDLLVLFRCKETQSVSSELRLYKSVLCSKTNELHYNINIEGLIFKRYILIKIISLRTATMQVALIKLYFICSYCSNVRLLDPKDLSL